MPRTIAGPLRTLASRSRGTIRLLAAGAVAAVVFSMLQAAPSSAAGGVTFDPTPMQFGPATIVSANYLGGEPQTSIERHVTESQPGAVDENRLFVDWPWSSRTQTSILMRSEDRGRSFRMLYDPSCAQRSRPTCQTLGGGDSEETVNLVSGTLLFADQEGVVVNEGLASSTDHGDTFPPERQFAVTNAGTVTDRQWLTPTDNSWSVGGDTIEALFSYHTPPFGYIIGVDANGTPIPQPVPQLQDVGQSGQPRIDTNPASPGYQWAYYPYWHFPDGAVTVASVFSPDYQNPTAWHESKITRMSPDLFTWVAVDDGGNAYVAWTHDGHLFYSYMDIHRPANDPTNGGRPGTSWSRPTEITPPGVGSTTFPSLIGGADGNLGVAFVGTTTCTGTPDSCPDDTLWNTYAMILGNATQRGGAATATVGIVSHRFVHQGNICTGGTGCTDKDRSLLDTIDLGRFEDGSIGVVFQDNYTTFQQEQPQDISPFMHFASETNGPSLLGTTISRASPVVDRTGDATWPVETQGEPRVYLPSLDEGKVRLYLTGNQLIGHIQLAAGTIDQMKQDLATYNSVPQSTNPDERLDYILRFSTGTEVFHMSMEVLADGTTRAYGGKLDANDVIENVTQTAAIGVGYRTDPGYNVTATLEGNCIDFTAPASDFGLEPGTSVYSVSAFATVGPLEDEQSQVDMMRTVDASPPFDETLGA